MNAARAGKTKKPSFWGGKRKQMAPDAVIRDAQASMARLNSRSTNSRFSDLSTLRESYFHDARSYFTLCAMTRRRSIDAESKARGLNKLYAFRSILEQKILADLIESFGSEGVIQMALSGSFFGYSKKQGVSIRYSLQSCVPTTTCGGRCYAHDGRDRELGHIIRGVLNFHVGSRYESGDRIARSCIMEKLSQHVESAIRNALEDSEMALASGYKRSARIRFSHIGEMAQTPAFTNALAKAIKQRCPHVLCVVYTRHPKAHMLDPTVLTINFTLEGQTDPRLKLVPSGARIVSSAWDGVLNPDAAINFLEHHVEKAAHAVGRGNICPVTLNHDVTPSCDSARCQKCFVRPL
jgi:hypothetical protein